MVDIKKKITVCQKKFCQKRILVIGDIMVDEYIMGKVSRISPEAPIPILDFKEIRRVAGGASNVANNLNSLGCKVKMCGVVGQDQEGEWLKGYLKKNGIDIDGVVTEKNRPTTLKQRYATKSQQLLRVDCELSSDILSETKENILIYLSKFIMEIDAIILSDYTKGLFKDVAFVRKIIKIANDYNVLIGIDSKSREISAFENATFVKPNNLELEKAIDIKIIDEKSLNAAGEKYLEISKAKALIVTRGAQGISLFQPGKTRRDFSSKALQVYDVTGAGDTVISVITLALSCGMEYDEAVVLANYAASVVIERVGTASITSEELVDRINEE